MAITRSTLPLSIFSLRFVLIYNFFVIRPHSGQKTNKLQLSATVLPNCKTNTQLLKNISYGNLVFTEQLFEVRESFWNKLSKN